MEQAEHASNAQRFFIYGSCVSRDAFEFDGAPALVDYVARSAVGSAFAEAPTELPVGVDLDLNPSPFQRRMVRLDLEKGLTGLLQSAGYDVLLLDLIDERLQMVRTGGSLITDSNEARTSGLASGPEERVRVGTDAYFALFETGLQRLMDTVPLERIVLNRVYWATHMSTGEELPNQEYINRHNAALRTAYGHIDAMGLRSIDYDPELFITDPTHKWGASPFHYWPNLYERTLAGLDELRFS